ncbi:phosphatidate cytidylyltransferase [Persephonella sp.]
MNNLFIRIVSAVILSLLAVAAVLYSPVWLFKILISILCSIAVWEVSRLLKRKFEDINEIEMGLISIPVSLSLLFLTPYLSIIIMILYGFYYGHKHFNINYLTSVTFIFIYGVFFVGSLGLLFEINRYLMFVLFATVWAGDTFAYFIGKKFGKHRLSPRLSPKKTWEGAVGSFFGSILVGGAVAYYFHLYDSFIPILISAVLIQYGDLFESFLKRQVDQKDSSNLIPGHGGLLDRIDGLIFGSVVFLIYYQIRFYLGF